MSRQPLRSRVPVLGGIGFAVAALGLFAALLTPSASADGLPVPPVTLPTLPISPPVTLPTDSSGAPSGSAHDASSGASGSTSVSGAGVRSAAAVEGAIALKGGAVSIPVTSVRAPARLVIDWVAFAPTVIRSARQPVQAGFRVTDSRGYLVRDALLDVRSLPADRIATSAMRPTGLDGVVRLSLRPAARPLRTGRLTIFVRAYAPGGARSGGIAALRVVSLPIRPR